MLGKVAQVLFKRSAVVFDPLHGSVRFWIGDLSFLNFLWWQGHVLVYRNSATAHGLCPAHRDQLPAFIAHNYQPFSDFPSALSAIRSTTRSGLRLVEGQAITRYAKLPGSSGLGGTVVPAGFSSRRLLMRSGL